MNEKKFKEKLVEFLVELGKPKRYEVGFVQGNKVINDGLNILGLTAIDILGFAKPAEDRRVRKSKGAQAWFKKMYESGWKYTANFEQEGLLTNGFVVMEKELPNKTLNIIREELEALLRDDEGEKYKHIPDPKILRGLLESKPVSGYVGDDMLRAEGKISISPEDVPKELMEMREEYIHKIKEPIVGFDSEVNDFIIDSQKEPKTYEDVYFEETGKNAVWRGKLTKAFKLWLKGLD